MTGGDDYPNRDQRPRSPSPERVRSPAQWAREDTTAAFALVTSRDVSVRDNVTS